MRIVLMAAVLVALGAPIADAAPPAAGGVSRSSPALVWEGTGSGLPLIYADVLLAAGGNPIICAKPFCDTFDLHVADSADLRIESSSCAADMTSVEVQRPDGSRLFADGSEGSPRTIIDIRQAPVGDYVVRTLVNVPPSTPGAYVGHATLRVPPTRADLTAASRRVAARDARSRAKIRVALATTAPVTAVRALLRKGHSVVGSGRLATLEGRGSLLVKLSRTLAPGAYRLTLTADDGEGPIYGRSSLRVARRAHAHTTRHRRAEDQVGPAAATRC